MNIIVTGGSGFIGSNIVDALLDLGHEVLVIDNLSTGNIRNLNPRARLLELDINSEEISLAFEQFKPELVYHLAAQVNVSTSIISPLIDEQINIRGSINLLNCCVKNKVRKIIYASSAAIYGVPQQLPISEKHDKNPISFYGISKYAPELYIKNFSHLNGIDFTILRYSNVYGPRQDHNGEGGVISIFTNKVLNNETPIIYGDGNQTRDFIYVKDIVNANLQVINKGSKGVYNISSNQTITLNDLVNYLSIITGKQISPIYQGERDGDIRDSCLDNTSSFKHLGWEPRYPLIDGLKETVNFYSCMEK